MTAFALQNPETVDSGRIQPSRNKMSRWEGSYNAEIDLALTWTHPESGRSRLPRFGDVPGRGVAG